jgi:hypothetical protein
MVRPICFAALRSVVPLRIAGADAGKTVVVRAPDHFDERIQTQFRRRMQMKSYSDSGHDKWQFLFT